MRVQVMRHTRLNVVPSKDQCGKQDLFKLTIREIAAVSSFTPRKYKTMPLVIKSVY